MNESQVQTPEFSAWRLFVAISLPEEVKSALCEVQRELRETVKLKSVGWTRRENLHLTLRFLGQVQPDCAPDLERRLRERLVGFGDLELTCERLGCFPNARFPRVVWTWVHDVEDRLATLHHRVDEAVGEFAEKAADKDFVGHVTLARPKQINRVEADALARFIEHALERRFGVWRCRELELIRSELSPGGSRYTTLATISFERHHGATHL